MGSVIMKGQVQLRILTLQSQALVIKAHSLTQKQLVVGLQPYAQFVIALCLSAACSTAGIENPFTVSIRLMAIAWLVAASAESPAPSMVQCQ